MESSAAMFATSPSVTLKTVPFPICIAATGVFSFLCFVWFLWVSRNKTHLLHAFQREHIEGLVNLVSASRDLHHQGVLEVLSLVRNKHF